jgi:hypothetical protein
MERTCTACGALFSVDERPGRGGRPRTRCDACRKPSGQIADRDAYNARRRAKRSLDKGKALVVSSERVNWHFEALLLAGGLAMHSDDVQAAAGVAGVTAPDEALPRLEGMARELYPGIISGEPDWLAKQAELIRHKVLMELMRGLHTVAPRDMPKVLDAVNRTIEMVRPNGVQMGSIQVVINRGGEIEIVNEDPGASGDAQ